LFNQDPLAGRLRTIVSLPVRFAPFARLVLAVLFTAAILSLPAARAAHADAAGGGGDYVPLSASVSVLDTRTGTGGVTGPRGAASTTSFPVLGVGSVPTTGVGSVLVRLVTFDPTESTFLELWPYGITRPNLTMLAVGAGEDLSNMSVVEVGDSGKISVYNNAGKTDVLVEVQGYFKSSQGSTGGGFIPLTHTRLIDTRTGLGTTTGTIVAGGSRTITIAGSLIPVGAAAAAVNVLVPGASAAGWLTTAPAGGTARPLFNYETGHTHSYAVLKLSSDGKVTITNKGSAAVNLVIHAEGYFSASSTQGAGLRQIARRLLNTRTAGAGLPLAADATIDVQVGGANGLPTRGIAGAQLAVVVTPEHAGFLKVWPTGDPEPSLTQMDYKAGIWRAQAFVVKPGTDGKIRFRNGSDSTIHLIVDLQGWYADPIPPVAVAQNTRMSVMQAAPVAGALAGTIEYSYVDNSGRVLYGHQSNPDSFSSVQWTVISGNEAFSGQPSLSQLSDGRMQVAAQNRDSDIWADSQTEAGASTWNSWADFGGSMASPPTAVRLGSGVLTQFAVDTDGKLWSYGQVGSQSYWRNLGDQDLVGPVTVITVRDGARIFGVDGQGTAKTIEYYDDGSLSEWVSLGGTGLSQPAVVVRPGYQLQAFARAADNTIVTKLQDAAGAWPADWQAIGGFTVNGEPATFAAIGAPAAILDPALGRVAVIVRGADNEIYQLWETAIGSGTWGNWDRAIGGVSDPSVTDPSVTTFTNSNGTAWLIAFRNANGAVRIYDRQLIGA
jgi:hypothetical protein